MKFSKRLQAGLIEEWRENYVSYLKLKRILKRMALDFKRLSGVGSVGTPSSRASPAGRSVSRTQSLMTVNTNNSSFSPPEERKRLLPGPDPRTEFFSTLDDDLARASAFFNSQWDALLSDWAKVESIGLLSGSFSLRFSSRGAFNLTGSSHSQGGGLNASASHGPLKGSSSTINAGGSNGNIITGSSSGHGSVVGGGGTVAGGGGGGTTSIAATGDGRTPQAILKDMYIRLIRLKSYCELNTLAIKKIVKKFDRISLESTWPTYNERLQKEAFAQQADIDDFLDRIQNAHAYVNTELHEIDNDPDVIKASLDTGPQGVKLILKPKWAALALVLAIILFCVPILPDNPPAHRCVSLVVFITVLWVTEAVPFFVSSLSIPFLVVVMRILVDPTSNDLLSADDAKTLILSKMFDHTVALIIGGFAISAAFSKHHYELHLASLIQQRFGQRPRLFLLMVMLLAWFLSAWISNVSAAVLVSSVLQPVMHDLPHDSAYVKALVLGLAFACNLGGMLTPIASPQNAIALGDLPEGSEVSFLQWMLVAVPFGLVALVLLWLWLLLVLKPTDVKYIPEIAFELQRYTWSHYVVLVVTLVTIGLWCTLTLTKSVFGDMSVVAFIPLVVFLSTGILSRNDFTSFSWPLIFLIAGGNCLGEAISSCGLLDIIGDEVEPILQGLNLWLTLLAIVAFLTIVTTFVSHTVSAIILIPIVVNISSSVGNTRQLVVAATLMCSASMALPMTSFPNVNALMMESELHRPYVKVFDFVRYGGPFTLVLIVLLMSFGYLLLQLVF